MLQRGHKTNDRCLFVKLPTEPEENLTITADTPSVDGEAVRTNYENRVKAYYDKLGRLQSALSK